MAGLDTALSGVTTWLENNLMLDTVRVSRPSTSDPVLDEETGEVTRPEPTVIYEGKGGVFPGGGPGSVAPGALMPWTAETSSPASLLTPLGAPIPKTDDIVTVVATHVVTNAALIGRAWVCTDPGRAGTVEVAVVTPLDMKRDPTGQGQP